MNNLTVSLAAATETTDSTAGIGQETRLLSLRSLRGLITPQLWLIIAFAAVIGLYVAHALSASS